MNIQIIKANTLENYWKRSPFYIDWPTHEIHMKYPSINATANLLRLSVPFAADYWSKRNIF